MALPSPKATILVIEDDPALRAFYRSTLRIAGYDVIDVEDGLDALRRLESDVLPDLVLLDMALPRVRGRDVHAELKAHADTRDIPIMVVSGTETRDLHDVACVIRKPVTPEQLIEGVEKCLRERRR